MAAKIFGKNAFAGAVRLALRHGTKPELAPGRFRTFDDESRGVGIELIGMRPDPAVLGLFKDKGKGIVEFLPGAEPDEFVLAGFDGRPEDVGEFAACP